MPKVTAGYHGRSKLKRRSVITNGGQPLCQNEEAVTDNTPVRLCEVHTTRAGTPSVAESSQRCLNAAVRFLKYRPRSEREVRERLRHHSYDSQCIDVTITALKEKGLIDDLAFARFWAENRDAFKPRSALMIKMELRRKGIAGSIIDQIVAPSDDMEGAYRAARQKARILPRTDYQSFHRRLGNYLGRRGFGYGIVAKVLARVWEEGAAGAETDRPSPLVRPDG